MLCVDNLGLSCKMRQNARLKVLPMLIINHHTVKQMALRLNCSVATIRKDLRLLYFNYRANNRVDFVINYYQSLVLDLENRLREAERQLC